MPAILWGEMFAGGSHPAVPYPVALINMTSPEKEGDQ
jgi:hypothetical protein